MRHLLQRTVGRAVAVSGAALHTGAHTTVVLRPAQEHAGVFFVRTDLPGDPSVPATIQHTGRARLATTLQRGAASVGTVEHLLATLAARGVSNARVDVNGPELPILDGSAAHWLRLVDSAGIVTQTAPRRVLRLRQAVTVRDGPRWVRGVPGPNLRLDVSLDFPDRVIGRQRYIFVPGGGRFRRELAWARTFAFLDEVEMMRAHGLGLGGGMDNAHVFTPTGPLDPASLREPDEPARHKALDLLGDLALLGAPLLAHVTAMRPGHALTAAFVRAVQDAVCDDASTVPAKGSSS